MLLLTHLFSFVFRVLIVAFNYYLVQTTNKVLFSVTALSILISPCDHSCGDLVIKMTENNAFTVLIFLHICSLSQDQYFKLVRSHSSSKSLIVTVRKITFLTGIKAFKSGSRRLEIAKIQNLHGNMSLDSLEGLQCRPDSLMRCGDIMCHCWSIMHWAWTKMPRQPHFPYIESCRSVTAEYFSYYGVVYSPIPHINHIKLRN